MENNWKQTIFKPEDFEGAGHYIIRETINKEKSPFISNSGYLSTIMYKVGWIMEKLSNTYCLIAMSDGMIMKGYYSNTRDKDNNQTPTEIWIWNPFQGESNHESKSLLCEYLNNNPHGETFRFATNEEVVRVVMSQRGYRTKG